MSFRFISHLLGGAVGRLTGTGQSHCVAYGIRHDQLFGMVWVPLMIPLEMKPPAHQLKAIDVEIGDRTTDIPADIDITRHVRPQSYRTDLRGVRLTKTCKTSKW